jgi:hypothetical protein
MKEVSRLTRPKASAVLLSEIDLPMVPGTEVVAAQAMWLYYRDHKLQFISDVRDHLAAILAQLMSGMAVELVFAVYFKPAEPVRVLQRSAWSRVLPQLDVDAEVPQMLSGLRDDSTRGHACCASGSR